MKMNLFNFSVKTDVCFGVESRKNIIQTIKDHAWSCIGVVVDTNLVDLPIICELLESISSNVQKVVVAECPSHEPTYQGLEKLRTGFCDTQLDVVIGIGGGSALDTAKGLAVLVHNTKLAISYRGFNQMTERVLPIIALPTTAGTGSEVTPNASFVDSDEMKKMGINGESVRPIYAFLDPELTLSCPRGATVSSAVDSMVHATEAFVAKKTNPMARLFAREGFQRVLQALPDLAESLNDIRLRSEVMYGAFLSGIALMHSGTGPAAAMSYPLGVHYGVPHGVGGAIFLPHVARLNTEAGYHEYGSLLEGFSSNEVINNETKSAQYFSELLQTAWAKLNVPASISQYKIDRDLFIKETLVLKGALDQNPVPFGEKEVVKVLDTLDT